MFFVHNVYFIYLPVRVTVLFLTYKKIEEMFFNEKVFINFTLRMPVDTRLKLEYIAVKEDRTITNLINMALKRYIEMYEGQKK